MHAVAALAAAASACVSVHRYGPDEEGPELGARWPSERRPLTRQPRAARDGGASGPERALGDELGDGTVAGELVAAARRVLGLRFGGEDATTASEQAAFEAHLASVALWSGAVVPVSGGRGGRGDLWVSPDGRVAVIIEVLGDRRWRVIGPVDGEDGVRVQLREVSGGSVKRALAEGVAG